MHTLKAEVGSVLRAPPLSLTLGFFPELCLVTDRAISSYKRALLTSKFSYCGLPCSEVTCPSSLPSFPAQPVSSLLFPYSARGRKVAFDLVCDGGVRLFLSTV